MHQLFDTLHEKLASGLMRKSASTCSRWAEEYVIVGKPIPGPIRFKYHPWSRTWHDLDEDWAGMKAAQLAMSQSAIDRCLFTVDIRRNDVMYLLPKKNPDAADFSKSKFDAILDLSPHISSMFSNVRNVGHKQAGNVNFYIRGMRSRSGLKSVSVGLMVFDEYDEMPEKSIALALERTSGYQEKDKQIIRISTPSIPEFGIAKEILKTSQEIWIFKCPKCGKLTNLQLTDLKNPECLVVTGDLNDERELRKSFIRCLDCKRPLEHESKPEWLGERNASWVPTARGFEQRGFLINQLYSTVLEPWHIAKTFLLAQTDGAHEQELFNSKLGLPRTVAGARVTEEMLVASTGNHSNNDPPRSGLVTMGVDVGHKVLYVNIDLWMMPQIGPDLNSLSIPRTLQIKTVDSFFELDALMREYQVKHCVIDVDPAFRDAVLFANRFPGLVNLCRFVRTVNPKAINPAEREGTQVVHVNRTYWLDISQTRYRRGTKGIIIPYDRPKAYNEHIKAMIRHEKKDDEGNLTSRYISTGADHYAFARVYSEIALPLAVSTVESRDVKDFL